MATGVVAELLATAPNIKFLITSRAPLRLTGEFLYEVPTLSPAVARDLFVHRATALRHSFKPSSHDEQAIADICRRLDYLPLAIELAAARIRLFEPVALLKHLAEPLTLLTIGPKDLPQRQRTLRSAIDWSYGILTPDEQTLFRRLGIFADGCTMTMIENIVAEDLTSPVIDLVQSLVDKSMLKTEPVNGEIRFRLLEMLREFASDLLMQSDEAPIIAERNAQWFVEQIDGMQSEPAIGDSLMWFDWFDTEVNNIRSVIHWSLQSGHIEYGLQIAAQLKVTWRLHGPVRDGFQLTMKLLAHPDARSDLHLYGRVLLTGAYVSEEVGDNVLSEQQLIEAEAIFRRLGDKRFLAWALSQRGDHAITNGDYLSARSLLEESEALFREVGDHRGLAVALLWFGTIERDQDNFQQALKIYDEVTFLARKTKSPVIAFLAAGWTAFVYHRMGDLVRATVLTERALEICQMNRLIGSSAIMLGALGNIAFERETLLGRSSGTNRRAKPWIATAIPT